MPTALTGLAVWDGVAERAAPGPWTIRIEGRRIAALGTAPALCEGAEIHDLDGATAIPGLIDGHVHMTIDPARGSPEAQLETPEPELQIAMAARARAMVAAGITTARDLGGAAWRELGLRDRIAAGELPGPRLLCAGQPLTARGGHCHFWGGEVETPAEIRACVRQQAERGADWIKVMATGGVLTRGTSVADAQFDLDRLRSIVECARDTGLPVAAHCHGTAGIRNAAEAGVDTIEHCSWAGPDGFGSDLDAAVVDRIAERGILISPTVNLGWGRRLGKEGEPSPFSRRMRGCFERLREAGVGIIASTDAGIPGVEHHRLAEGLEVFAAIAGLSPREVLVSATSGAASGLGLDAETGRLHVGLSADILVLNGDPLADLSALRQPRLTVARGRVLTQP